jgi:uncharacterized protein (TIGR02466 family)
MKVTPLFSTPLVHTNIGKIDPITFEWIKNLEYPENSVGTVPGDYTTRINRGFDILDNPKLKNLRAAIWNVADHLIYNILDVRKDQKFRFTTSWINKVVKGEQIGGHIHANSLISGVYYVDVSENSAPITFRKNLQHLNLFSDTMRPQFNEGNFNQFNTDKITVTPTNGDLLLFPSHLMHSVDYSDESKDRYSLAFNIFCDGFIGTGSEQITV